MLLLFISSLLLMSTSILFTRLQHPLAMGLTLISQTLMICITTSMLSSFVWFSYILFLIFLGATLVLFIYIASLASNETFKLSYPLTLTVTSPLLFMLPLSLKDELTQPINPMSEPSSLSLSETIYNPYFDLSMIYNPTGVPLTSFIILYLLLTLIVVVKLTSSSTGPLRLS